MDRKMLVLDIDGTLTNSKKEITKKTEAAVKEIMKEGHVVVIASGRPTPGIMGVCDTLELEKYGGFGMSYNGAKITDMKTGKVVFQKTLPREIIPELFEYAVSEDVGLMTYEKNSAVTGTRTDGYMELEARINKIGLKSVENFSEYVDFDVNKCLMTAEDTRAARMEKELAAKYDGVLSIYRSEPFFVEIMPRGVDKAASLGVLLDMLGMKREDMICCGDGFNDISMIKYAGTGVAMGNAIDEVKAAADFVTLSNDEDGLVPVIDKYIRGI